jgi:nitroreductase
MEKRTHPLIGLVLALILTMPSALTAQDLKPLPLPKPQTEGGRPLMQVLKDRKTVREYSPKPLTPQMMADLLWAAWGINRADSGRRTAPSSVNKQEIDLYVAINNGLFLYDAKGNSLIPVSAKDIRALTGMQPYAKESPISLIFVADFSRVTGSTDEEKGMNAWADTGFISQNVYLFCASEGLATGVRARIDRQALAKEMKLRPDQRITMAQSVGFPKGKE